MEDLPYGFEPMQIQLTYEYDPLIEYEQEMRWNTVELDIMRISEKETIQMIDNKIQELMQAYIEAKKVKRK